MYIPQDVVNLIIDQLVLPTTVHRGGVVSRLKPCRYLKATSPVSTSWVNPSQRHLFSFVSLHSTASMQKWCSNIRPGPRGVSRHVRVLELLAPSLVSDDLATALPHLTSFQNLQELEVGQAFLYGSYRNRRIDIDRVSLEVLVPIFSSFAGTLKRLIWTQRDTAHETWKILYTLTDLLPNLIDIDLSGVGDDLSILAPVPPHALPRIYLSSVNQPPDPFAFKHFKFQELKIMDPIPPSPRFLEHCQTHLRVLDFWYSEPLGRADYTPSHVENAENLRALFEACHALQEVSFPFGSYIGWLLGSIPSNSVTLIRLRHLEVITTYDSCWDNYPECFAFYLSELKLEIQEYERLGVSIREIAQRFSKYHCGLKTWVQAIYRPSENEAQAIANGEVPFFMTKLEEELGTLVTLELDLLPYVPDDTL